VKLHKEGAMDLALFRSEVQVFIVMLSECEYCCHHTHLLWPRDHTNSSHSMNELDVWFYFLGRSLLFVYVCVLSLGKKRAWQYCVCVCFIIMGKKCMNVCMCSDAIFMISKTPNLCKYQIADKNKTIKTNAFFFLS
jgi:hypothetical protein